MMTGTQPLRAELDAMREELSHKGAIDVSALRTPANDAAQMTAGTELESLLQELQAKLEDASRNTEDLVKSHPVVALASAFLIGIAVGRSLGRH